MSIHVGSLLSKTWNTGLLADPSMFGFMVLVRLPDDVLPVEKAKESEKSLLTDQHAEKLQDILHCDFKVEVWKVNIIANNLL